MTLKDKCIELGVNYRSILYYKQTYKCSEEIAFKHYKPNLKIDASGRLVGYEHFYINTKSLRQKCLEANVDYVNARSYKKFIQN